jgi:hypothetical protein
MEARPHPSVCAIGMLMLLGAASPATGASRWDLGLMAALDRSSLSGDPIPETSLKPRLGFHVGAHAGMRVREDIDLGVEPSYSRRGGDVVTVVDDENDVEQTTHVDLDYLDLPVLVRVHGSARSRPYAEGGLGVGFLLDAKAHPPGAPSVDLSDALHGTDVFACFGGGAAISMAGRTTYVGGRYTQGLRNVNRGEPANGAGTPDTSRTARCSSF